MVLGLVGCVGFHNVDPDQQTSFVFAGLIKIFGAILLK